MLTRKSVGAACGLAIVLGAFVIFGGIKDASARVNINLNLGAPPQEVVVVPGGVAFVPDQGNDVFFYGGYWWATRDNEWYRSRDYNGRWRGVDRRYVPAPVHRTYGTPNYREAYSKQDGERVPYGQWKKNGHKGMAQGKHEDKGGQRDKGEKGNKHGHDN